jgi:hypothetical protein
MDTYVTIALIAFLSSAFTALIGMLFKLCYASKCRTTSICWNCLRIERDTTHEQSIRNLNLDTNIKMPNFGNQEKEIQL